MSDLPVWLLECINTLPEVSLGVREAMLINLNEKFDENLVLLRCRP